MGQWKGMTRTVKLTGWIIAGISAVIITGGIAIIESRAFQTIALDVIALLRRSESVTFWSDKMQWLGVEMIISGALLLVGSQVVIHKEIYLAKIWRESAVSISAVILLIALWLPIIVWGHSAVIGGERYWWLDDDAMISMRYAHNLARGEGLVWNVGEHIEGYTNFLWTIIMSAVHLLPASIAKMSLIVLLINLGLAIAAIPLIRRIVNALGGDTKVLAASLFFFVLNENIVFWTTSGFETMLLTLLLLLSIERIIADQRKGQQRLLTYLIITTMSLVRADAIVFTLLCFLLSLYLNKWNLKVVKLFSVALIIPAAHLTFRYFYYGDILPNTAYLKAMKWHGKYLAGSEYLFGFILTFLPIIGLAFWGAIKAGKKHWYGMLGLISLYAVYIASVGGDVFKHYRFFVPILPLLTILAFMTVFMILKQKRSQWIWMGLVLLFVPLIVPGYPGLLYSRPSDKGNVEIGLLLQENTTKSTKVADFWAGSVFYFNDCYAIDFLGKSDKFIAHRFAHENSSLPGHNKFDFNYSLGEVKPDLIVASFKLPVDESKLQQYAAKGFLFTPMLFLNEIFQQEYYSHPIEVKTWRTIFANSERVNDLNLVWDDRLLQH